MVLHDDADNAAGHIGLPVLALGLGLLCLGQFVPPAELLQQHVIEFGITGGEVGTLRVRTVLGQQVDAVLLHPEVGAEVAAAFHYVL